MYAGHARVRTCVRQVGTHSTRGTIVLLPSLFAVLSPQPLHSKPKVLPGCPEFSSRAKKSNPSPPSCTNQTTAALLDQLEEQLKDAAGSQDDTVVVIVYYHR